MSVAVTGATGFLGLHLVRELLRRDRTVVVLTRPGPVPAAERIRRFLAATGVPEAETRRVTRRVRAVEADLGRPGLGLAPDAYRRLADDVDVLWHCAADTSLAAPLAALRRVNVEGTRHVLALAAAGARAPLVCHVSTVAVAGARRHGTVLESDLDASHGFHTPYEQSKFEAELLVRRWAREHGGRALVARPSGLVTRRPLPGGPPDILRTVADALGTARRACPGLVAADGAFTLHGFDAESRTNLLPVEHAAAVLAELPRAGPHAPAATYHLVHPYDVPIAQVTAALGRHLGVTVRLGRESGAALGDTERAVRRWFAMYVCWLRVTRRYDAGNLDRLGLPVPPPARVDEDYLVDSLSRPRVPGQEASRAPAR
ncbi:SDR family oxidoreductase [Streptomyces sp. B1866]|uniref:SDR family oxidoreductase n=1 Tax=Streptomyces sp. B1866 TaxID=3075431 RepID=UPI002891FF19|nr:SDR family oxidoreductase [Streptomyces sp. B1866]MDT3397738.1 SDR family oxidoreductase [Streptomyces sp. B1866]